jgi:hypothetical protein
VPFSSDCSLNVAELVGPKGETGETEVVTSPCSKDTLGVTVC